MRHSAQPVCGFTHRRLRVHAADQAAFRERLRRTRGDEAETRAFLKRLSMLASLERAAELG